MHKTTLITMCDSGWGICTMVCLMYRTGNMLFGAAAKISQSRLSLLIKLCPEGMKRFRNKIWVRRFP